MLAPIPRYLLVHHCLLRKVTAPDAWGGGGTVSETEVNFVRIEPCRSEKFSLGGDIPEVSAKLFYDSFSSVPNDIAFEPKDKVIFGLREFTVTEVRPYYGDTGEIHHTEVLLS